MSKIIISTETSADLPYKIVIPNNIKVVPFTVSFNKNSMSDENITSKDIFDFYNKSKIVPKTSAVNPDEYVAHFKKIFNDYNDCKIIHIALSSKISTAYQNAIIASSEFDPDKISIIDSKNVSAGQGLLVMYACSITKKFQNKLSLIEYASLINNYSKKIKLYVIPNGLEYLKAGGRVSNFANIGANILKIKPGLVVENGSILAGKKYRGDIPQLAFKVIHSFTEQFSINRDCLIILYSSGVSKNLLFSLKREAHKLNYKKSWCFTTGSMISSHIGPSSIGFAGVSIK